MGEQGARGEQKISETNKKHDKSNLTGGTYN